jgi:hypothetical protein
VGEFDVITRYFSSLGSGEFVDLSVGDDAAALTVPPNSELIVSTDSSVLDTHFTDDVFPWPFYQYRLFVLFFSKIFGLTNIFFFFFVEVCCVFLL